MEFRPGIASADLGAREDDGVEYYIVYEESIAEPWLNILPR